MSELLQFEGKIYHKECFNDWLAGERVKARITPDYTPNVKEVALADLDVNDECEECGVVLSKEDVEDDEPVKVETTSEQRDNVINTPSPTPLKKKR